MNALRNRPHLLLSAALLTLTVGGCDDVYVDPIDEIAQSRGGGGGGGWQLNTSEANGIPLPELDLSGSPYNGHTFEYAEINVYGQPLQLDHVWVEDGDLVGSSGEQMFHGAAFDGGTLHIRGSFGSLASDAPALLTIERDLDDEGVPIYTLKFAVEDDYPEGLTYLCAADASNMNVGLGSSTPQYGAYLLSELAVDPESAEFSQQSKTMYIACASGAIGKARQWGYDPSALGLVAFETIVRAIRADYCGDGVSHTAPGTPFFLQDSYGVQSQKPPASATEAFWDESGAVCQDGDTRGDDIPGCFLDLPSCSKIPPTDVVTYVPNP